MNVSMYREYYKDLLEVQSSRTINNIGIDKVESVKNKLFNVATLSGVNFYRKSKFVYDPPFINPKKIQRASKDTFNLYYIIMDTFPAWKGWPSRSKSVIFTNSESTASDYTGIMYKVYPANNAKIAWGNYSEDFLHFPYLEDRTGLMLTRFLTKFREMVRRLTKRSLLNDINQSDWDDMSKYIDIILSKYDWSSNRDDYIFPDLSIFIVLKDGYEKGMGINDILNDLFDPIKNLFKMRSLSAALDYFKSDKHPKEIWTDSLCYVERV